jgi:hypothetical protein
MEQGRNLYKVPCSNRQRLPRQPGPKDLHELTYVCMRPATQTVRSVAIYNLHLLYIPSGISYLKINLPLRCAD